MIPLCLIDTIADPGARGFTLEGHSLVAVRLGNSVCVWHNRCPHLGIELNWLPDQFLDVDQRLIQCAMHGALFSPDSGTCIYGPCRGAALTPVPSRVADGWLLVTPLKEVITT